MKRSLGTCFVVMTVTMFLICGSVATAQDDAALAEKIAAGKLAAAKIAAMEARYKDALDAYTKSWQKLGKEHPTVKRLYSEIRKGAYGIRNARLAEDLVSPEKSHKKIFMLAKELAATLGELQPLVDEEKDLKQALAHLERALASMKAKQAMRVDLTKAAAAKVRANSEQLQFMEQRIDVAAIAAMNRQVKDAKLLADIKNLEQIEAIQALSGKLTSTKMKKMFEALSKKEGGVSQRLDRLEAELAEIKAMLKKIAAKINE